MLRSILKKTNLKKRIYGGFLTTGLLAFVIIIISFITIGSMASSFLSFLDFSRQSVRYMSLSKSVVEMQRQAMLFTYEGHPTAAFEVREQYEKIVSRMNAAEEPDDPELVMSLETIREHLQVYIETFRRVEEMRKRRTILVEKQIRSYATETEEKLKAYILKTRDPVFLNQSARGKSILYDMQIVEKNIYQYFDSLDQLQIKNAKRHFASVKRELRTLRSREAEPGIQKNIDELLDILTRYEATFLETVQHIRGYLFLTNVVMAAEVYEILYNARSISDHLENHLGLLTEEIQLSIWYSELSLVIIAVVLLLLMVLLSISIVNSITEPIQKLARTFRHLAKGSRNQDIPEYELKDEIGDLTLAAAVFKDRNQETEDLLTRSRNLARELQERTFELERSNEEMEQFVYTVSHDLKSPVVTSMGFIGIIQKLISSGRYDEVSEKLNRVIKANERMGQLINDLLDLSRVGRVDIEITKIDLNSLLENFYNSHKETLKEQGFELYVKGPFPIIEGNESRILEVFENLLGNAIKYAHNADEPSLTVYSETKEEGFDLCFSDNGPGIPEDFQKKVFGLFYRLDKTNEGTGIGLAVVKKIMKFHGGDARVETNEVGGARFRLSFPRIGTIEI